MKPITLLLAAFLMASPMHAMAQQQEQPADLPEAVSRIADLERDNAELAAELAALRAAFADTEVLRVANVELEANNTALQERVEMLARDLAEARTGERYQQFINGAGAVLAGIVATLLIVWLWPRKRRSEWG